MAYTNGMSRNPFVQTKDQSTEMGWGAGMFPDPMIDYSDNGIKSRIPIGDPDRRQQYLDLMTARRTDLNRTDVPDLPTFQGDLPVGPGSSTPTAHPDYYTEGNTERYGANPPLVRAKGRPSKPKPKYIPRAKMEREF